MGVGTERTPLILQGPDRIEAAGADAPHRPRRVTPKACPLLSPSALAHARAVQGEVKALADSPREQERDIGEARAA